MSNRISRPDDAEEAKINQGIAEDSDTRVMSDDEFQEAQALKRGRGRPLGSVAEVRKEQVTVRLDPDIVAIMRASGAGWQSKVNDILRTATERGMFASATPSADETPAQKRA